jgi:hypothetical protein
MADERDVVRCANARCRLNQFRTANGNCRKCREPLPQKEIPEIKIEVLQPVEIIELAPQPQQPVRRPRNLERKEKKLPKVRSPKVTPQPKQTALSCYEEFRRAGSAKERREIIMRYLST